MAAFMYYALYKQLTGKPKSQQGCSDEFSCQTTPFKHLVTGKKQPGGPSIGKGEGRGKSTHTTRGGQAMAGNWRTTTKDTKTWKKWQKLVRSSKFLRNC